MKAPTHAFFFFLLFLFCCLSPNILWGHARLLSPVPRSNNAGIKTGPCGGLARTATPTTVQGGKMLTVNWEETINHPGKFIFSLSLKDDLNFNQNVLKQVLDDQNGNANLPHAFTTQLLIPDMDCATCTLQMIQSMEENPAAPTYYYSCADIKIVSSQSTPPATPTTPNPPTDTNQTQSTNTSTTSVKQNPPLRIGGGCGTVQSIHSDSMKQREQNLLSLLGFSLLMLLPLLFLLFIREKARRPLSLP